MHEAYRIGRLLVEVLHEVPELGDVVLAYGSRHVARARVVSRPTAYVLAVGVQSVGDEDDYRRASRSVTNLRQPLEGQLEPSST